jgi:hypothetical protein
MTLAQIHVLIEILESKVAEALVKLEATPIDSAEYNVILNNMVASTSLSNKLKMDITKLNNKGEE